MVGGLQRALARHNKVHNKGGMRVQGKDGARSGWTG
jgi:hypothetical protein